MRFKRILISLTTGALALGLLSGCGNNNQPHHHQQSSQQSTQSSQSNNNQNNSGPKTPKKKASFKSIKVPKLNYQPVNNLYADIKTPHDNWAGYYGNPQNAYRGMVTQTATNSDPKLKMPGAIGMVDETKFPQVKLIGVYKHGKKTLVCKGVFTNTKNKGKVIYTPRAYTLPHKKGQLSKLPDFD